MTTRKERLKKLKQYINNTIEIHFMTNKDLEQYLTKKDREWLGKRMGAITVTITNDGDIKIPVRDILFGITQNEAFWD